MNINDGRPLDASELSQNDIQTFAKSVTVYKDDHVWLVDKPAGLLSVPGKMLKDSLLSRLERADARVKLIHRLDMDTSGLMVFAIGKPAQTHISKQFIARTTDKVYEALVFGTLTGVGEVDAPVRYDPPNKPRHIVDMNHNKHALTQFEALHHELRAGKPITRVALYPVTGRSHQLRVHMLHVGHVMLGDPIYAKDWQPAGGAMGVAFSLCPRLALHAKALTFTHPHTGKTVSFEAKVPF